MSKQNINIKYFKVKLKFGHIGRKYCYIFDLPIEAFSAKEAAQKGRETPRVKHDHPDAVIDVKRITYLEFINLIKAKDSNKYFASHSRQEQKALCPDLYQYKQKDNHYKEYHDYYDKVENAKLKRNERIAYRREKEKLKHKYYRDDFEY